MTNSKKTFIEMRKKENYTKKREKLKFRARSYFKIEQIDKKFNLVKENFKILDLGCAPGAFLEYINNKLKYKNFELFGFDILEVKNQFEFNNTKIINDSFENISDYFNEENFDLILCDIAEEFSGNKISDRGKVHKINLRVLELSQSYLKKNSNLVFKSFYGDDYDKYVLKYCKKLFSRIVEFKPKSSQKKSSEFYVVCLKKK